MARMKGMKGMKKIINLYRLIPPQYRLPLFAFLGGIIILLAFTGMTLYWLLKTAFSLGFKFFIAIAVCILVYKIMQRLKKRKTSRLRSTTNRPKIIEVYSFKDN
jgi:membrane protein implicated in regulation of membrane protease activity